MKAKKEADAFWAGSYTVEAAAVIPVVFLVMSALIICSFYVHDRGVMQSLACEMSAAGRNTITREERKAVIKAIEQRADKSRFLGSRDISASISAGEKEINAVYSAEYPIPGLIMKYFSDNRIPVRKSWHGKLLEPVKTIWGFRAVKQFTDGGLKQ